MNKKTHRRRVNRYRTLLNKLWTVEDFMHFAQIGKNKAYDIINAGEINYIRTHGDNGHIRFTKEHIQEWVDKNGR